MKQLPALGRYCFNPSWLRPVIALFAADTLPTYRQAQFLAQLLVPVVVLNIAGFGLIMLTGLMKPLFPVIAFSTAMLGLIEIMSQTRYYRWCAPLLLLTVYTGVFLAILAVDESAVLTFAPGFLVVVVLLASQLCGTRDTVLAAIFSLLGIAALMVMHPDYALVLMVPFALVWVTSALLLVASVTRQRSRIELEQQSRALAESEDRYRSLLKAAMEGIILHNNGIVVDANETCEALFGYTIGEAVGMSVLDLAAPQSRQHVLQQSDRMDEPVEALARRKDGTIFPVEMVQRVTSYRGKPARVVVIRDVTERARAEKQKLELMAERERLSVLQRFVSDASHDLRMPLTNIKTSLYLLKRYTENMPKRQHYLQVMDQETGHLERLIDDMLTMSRLEQGVGEMVLNMVDLNELVRELLPSFTARARPGQIIKEDLAAALPMVWGDSAMIAQALGNLMNNALSYTPEGTIRLSTYALRDVVGLEVRDNGLGIKAADLPHIFDSFYRADAARSTHTGGHGLGLPIARKIIEMHGGSIRVESAQGSGTTFSILLPAAETQQSLTRTEKMPRAI